MSSADLDATLWVNVLSGLQPYPITVALTVDHRALSDPGCSPWALARYQVPSLWLVRPLPFQEQPPLLCPDTAGGFTLLFPILLVLL